MSSGKRYFFADLAKVIGAFLVILGHTYIHGNVRNLIYAFHMPLFFFIGGLFFKPAGIVRELTKDFWRLIIPAVFFTILLLVERCLVFGSPFWPSIQSVFTDVFQGKPMHVNVQIWFLIVLALIRLIAAVWFHNRLVAIGIVLAGLLSFRFNLFYFAQVEICLPFFAAGYLCKDFILKRAEAPKDKRILLPVLAVTAVASFILTHLNGAVDIIGLILGSLPKGLNIVVFYLNAFLGISALLAFCLLFDGPSRVVDQVSPALLTIVGLQEAFLCLVIHFWGYNLPHYITFPVSICILILCVLADKVLTCYVPILVGKKEKN